ncbi:MAG: hypothetical protein NTU80_05190 [Verrucomicrobia bacterium]|nr:hypothetical protein [Verrucomicrobiota bacterium]
MKSAACADMGMRRNLMAQLSQYIGYFASPIITSNGSLDGAKSHRAPFLDESLPPPYALIPKNSSYLGFRCYPWN